MSTEPVPRTIFVAHSSSLLTDHRPHGDGLAAYQFVRRLTERGHRIHVVVENMDVRQPLPTSLVVHRLRPRRAGSVRDRLRLMQDIDRCFRSVSRAEPVDIVHQLNPVDLGLTGFLRLRGTPLVLGPYVPAWPATPGASELRTYGRSAAELLIRWWEQRRAAALLLSTPAAQSRTSFVGRVRPAIHYLSAGVDETKFGDRSSRKSTSTRQILFLANLEERKGVLTLLRAFETVGRALPECELVIGGDGSARSAVESSVASSRLRDRIHMIGRVEPKDVSAIMSKASVFCMPSYGEPFGIGALEAMASRLPVVATNSGGLRYLLAHQSEGLVEPRDPESLAQGLIRVLQDLDRAPRLGEGNRRVVEERYTWSGIVRRLERIYDEVLVARHAAF